MLGSNDGLGCCLPSRRLPDRWTLAASKPDKPDMLADRITRLDEIKKLTISPRFASII
jgi:hypothetical protein